MSPKHLALLATVILGLAPRAPACAQLPRFELSTGLGWPRSGALERYWGAGPSVGLQWLASEPRGVFSSLAFRYNHFSRANFGTHGLRTSWALHARPAMASPIDFQAGAGVGGLWTLPTSPGDAGERPLGTVGCEECGFGVTLGEIHGWGPTVEVGLGLVFLEEEATGARATLRALWVRTWASDTFLDQLTIEMAWGLR